MQYSVLYDPVIPVIFPDGNCKILGIREVFLRAHELRDIHADTPLMQYALLRFLLAFAMDMLHPETSYDRKELLEQKQFDSTVFDEYVKKCEKDGPRFDLFDSVHPFLQSSFDAELDKKAEKSVAALFHDLPSGNNHIFIDHRLEHTHAVSFPKAFQALCSAYLFCVSGTAGPSSVNNTPPLYVSIVGQNLFETLVLNMLAESEIESLPYGTGNVPWRTYPKVVPKKEVAEVSLLEGLTWMPRRITLIPDSEGNAVRRVYCQAGLNFKGNNLWKDPYVPEFKKKDDSFATVKPESGRAIWRDVGTLLYDKNSSTVRQPRVLECITNMYDEEEIPEWIPVRANGLVTNHASYIEWVYDELSLPKDLLKNQNHANTFRQDLAMIENLQRDIYATVQKNTDRLRGGSVSKENSIAVQCQMYFLSLAHDMMFGTVMMDVVNDVPIKDHISNLCDQVKAAVSETIRHVLANNSSDARSIMQQIVTEDQIWACYGKAKKKRKEGVPCQ